MHCNTKITIKINVHIQVFHTISIWLTLLLAVWRYISVAHPLLSRDWCTQDRALLLILLAYVCSPLVCIPLYLTFTIQEQKWSAINSNVSIEWNITSIDANFTATSADQYTLYFLGNVEIICNCLTIKSFFFQWGGGSYSFYYLKN